MKRQQMLVLTAILLVGAGCSNAPDPNGNGGNSSVAFSQPATSETQVIQALPVNLPADQDLVNQASITPGNVENKAGLANTETLVLSLTGSSSCPPTPETISLQKDTLHIQLKEDASNCTKDLAPTLWKIKLPSTIVPRTQDLNVAVVSGEGLKFDLLAKAP